MSSVTVEGCAHLANADGFNFIIFEKERAPPSAVWDASESHWVAENKGISPDIEIENDPELIRQGHDLN